MTSWGVLLSEAQNINAVALYPWLMLPVVPVRPRSAFWTASGFAPR